MKSKAIKNVVFGFGGQAIVIILSVIIPRIMLVNYGSDINGLLTTISQIFVYMQLLEAGIGQAAMNALYKPIAERDLLGISYVASVAQNYYRRITRYYAAVVMLIAVVSPFVLKTSVPRYIIFVIIILEGMSGVVSFYFSQTQIVILQADAKSYVNNAFSVVNKIASNVVKIVMASLGVNIIFLEIGYFVISVAKAVFYQAYFKTHYGWINYKAAPKSAQLKDRNAFILNEIAWTIFSSTDMIILSTFISTQAASVYSVYNLVFSNLNLLLNTVYSSVSYILGQTYYKKRDEYVIVHDGFTSVFLGAMTILMCISYNLILPFIKLYTAGVSDIDYINPSLPVMFCLVQIFSWSRFVTGSLTGIAGYAKQVGYISVIQAIMNIVLSVALVHKFAIVGVLAGTVIALPIKFIYCAYISDKYILKRSFSSTIKILGGNYILFAFAVLIGPWLQFSPANYLDFFVRGIMYGILFVVAGTIVNVLANPKVLKLVHRR